MLKESRHDYILNEVRIRNRVLLSDLANFLKVSEDTVRRDLKTLHKLGKLKKVHGGAVARSFVPFSLHQDEIHEHANKQIIARKALPLLSNGQVILITGGTSNLEFVSLIPEDLHLTFFTPSLQIAMQLAQYEHIETILIGGKVAKYAQVTLGADALKTLEHVRADLCFLGTGHLHANEGLSEFDWEVVQLKQAMIRSSKKIISLTISAKLNSIQRYKVCNTSDIHTLVTELDSNDELLRDFRKSGVEVL